MASEKPLRQILIEQLYTDLTAITTSNNYRSTIKEVQEGINKIGLSENYPNIVYSVEDEKITINSADRQGGAGSRSELDIYIILSINANDVTTKENAIFDIKKYFKTCNFYKVKNSFESYISHYLSEILISYVNDYSIARIGFITKFFYKTF